MREAHFAESRIELECVPLRRWNHVLVRRVLTMYLQSTMTVCLALVDPLPPRLDYGPWHVGSIHRCALISDRYKNFNDACYCDGIHLREKRLWQTLHSYGRSLVSVLHIRLVLFPCSFKVTDATAHVFCSARSF
jgi:hypothetical protein